MNYRIKMNKNISLKDRQTFKEIMMVKNIYSLPVSSETINYLKSNYKDNIIDIENYKEEILINKTDNKTENTLLLLDEFNISDDEMDSILNIEDNPDRIFINEDDYEDNFTELMPDPVIPEPIALEKRKVVIKAPVIKKRTKKEDKISNEDLDINTVLDFFIEDDE